MADAFEQSVLESKDREQLIAIATALGVKSTSRAKKADLIQKILEQTGATSAPSASAGAEPAAAAQTPPPASPASAPAQETLLGPDGEPLADWELELMKQGISTETEPVQAPPAPNRSAGRVPTPPGRGRNGSQPPAQSRPAPPAPRPAAVDDGQDDANDDHGDDDHGSDDGPDGDGDAVAGETEGESRNRRRRRRRNKNRAEGDQGPNQQGGGGQQNPNVNRIDRPERPEDAVFNQDPVEVTGLLDLRDEGYGFLRVNGWLSSREDSYIPVKLTRQHGLRRGDHLAGLSRPAARNEKNPAMLEVHTVNGADPETSRNRARFDDLTAVSPDARLTLENPGDTSAANTAARMIDLVSPIGFGQRGLIVAPPRSGKTSILKAIATAIEHNHPDVELLVLLVDERPEDITEIRRSLGREVIASALDRPSEEHVHLAELCLERAKRLVEQGDDVVILVDGLTRLARAYNLAGVPAGRGVPGGIDAGAVQAIKRWFGAARKAEEGGSLTILGSVAVETGSAMDEVIFEELSGAANMELRLDRELAERRIQPSIDVAASSTRNDDALFAPAEVTALAALRGAAAAGGVEAFLDRIRGSATNAELLAGR